MRPTGARRSGQSNQTRRPARPAHGPQDPYGAGVAGQRPPTWTRWTWRPIIKSGWSCGRELRAEANRTHESRSTCRFTGGGPKPSWRRQGPQYFRLMSHSFGTAGIPECNRLLTFKVVLHKAAQFRVVGQFARSGPRPGALQVGGNSRGHGLAAEKLQAPTGGFPFSRVNTAVPGWRGRPTRSHLTHAPRKNPGWVRGPKFSLPAFHEDGFISPAGEGRFPKANVGGRMAKGAAHGR